MRLRHDYVPNSDVFLRPWGLRPQDLNFGVMEKNVDGFLRNIDIVLRDKDGDTKGVVAMGGIKSVLY